MTKNSIHIRLTATFCCALVLLLFGLEIPAGAGAIDSSLRAKLVSLGPGNEIPVLIKLAGKADLEKIKDKEKIVRKVNIIRELRETAALSQKHLQAFLEKKKIKKYKSLWLINGIAATVPAALVNELAIFPGVEAVTLDAVIHAPVTTYSTAAAPEWNITAIHAQELWNLGYAGEGVVVASMDTGVNADHPDLQSRWRGGTNSWFDPNGEHASPADVDGHGTQTMGIMVGGDAGGTSIGLAPGAQWIAVKIFNDVGEAQFSAIHQGYQWLLDPDENLATNDAPDVVNNSWGLQDPTHGCITEFQADIQALKAAGIALTFSAGNDGPAAATSVSPANYPESFSVGAVDSTNTVLNFSSRGPSACGAGIFPNVVAPGVNVRTSDLYLGIPVAAYTTVTGSSFAAPHVAGAIALLLSAFPECDVSVIETALVQAATDLAATGPDNDYGNGLIDVLGAYRFLKADKIAVYFDGLWYADVNGNGQWDGEAVDRTYRFGFAGAHPVSGGWSGGGTSMLGVYDPATALWYLDYNGNGAWDATPTDNMFFFGTGLVSADPVTGDWTGAGNTKIGIYTDGVWYLDLNGNGAWDGTPTDGMYTFGAGLAGALPVTGDWAGTGISRVGVYDNGTWYLDLNGNGAWDGTPTDGMYTFGAGLTGALPVTGDWMGTGTTGVGVYDNGTWYVDLNGNGTWDGTPLDGLYYYGAGLGGVLPVAGKW